MYTGGSSDQPTPTPTILDLTERVRAAFQPQSPAEPHRPSPTHSTAIQTLHWLPAPPPRSAYLRDVALDQAQSACACALAGRASVRRAQVLARQRGRLVAAGVGLASVPARPPPPPSRSLVWRLATTASHLASLPFSRRLGISGKKACVSVLPCSMSVCAVTCSVSAHSRTATRNPDWNSAMIDPEYRNRESEWAQSTRTRVHGQRSNRAGASDT